MRNVVLGLCVLLVLCSFAKKAHAFDPTPGTVTLLNLTSDCLPCALQNRVLAKVEAFYGERLVVSALDVDADPSLKTNYHLEILPTLILYDTKGQEVFRHPGFLRETQLKEQIQRVFEAH